jgi:hypothetical protein
MHRVSRGYFEQLPRPSHLPVWPQVIPPISRQMARGSGWSVSTGQQIPPRPARLQEMQGPWHATLQQTPSAQNPEAHWSLRSQEAPCIILPQLALAHCWPLTHWLFVEQVL